MQGLRSLSLCLISPVSSRYLLLFPFIEANTPARNFEDLDLSYEHWRSVLHLSTRWGFVSLRKLALRLIDPPTAYDRLLLARKYAVDDWIVPALTALCERTAPINLDEARGMTMEDVVLIATIREDIRTKAIRPGVKPAEISRRVEAMQAGTPIPAADYEVAPEGPPSEVIDIGPGSMVNANIGPGLEMQSGDRILVIKLLITRATDEPP